MRHACPVEILATSGPLRVDACSHGTVHVSGSNWTIRMTAEDLGRLAEVAAIADARLDASSSAVRVARPLAS